MSVVITSVIIFFSLIFLGFFLGKVKVVKHDSIPDLSSLVIQVTMPAMVFCSIIDQQGSFAPSEFVQVILAAIVLHGISLLITLVVMKPMRIPEKERGVWLYSGMLTNNGFIGIPLAQAIYGNQGMFIMAMANMVCNILIYSVGIVFLTRHYDVKCKFSIRQMLFNNINIAVVVGFIFLLTNIPIPGVVDEMLSYIANITSGLSMLVVGLSLSRLAFKDVFADKKMYVLTALRLVVIPLVTVLIIRLLPFKLNPVVEGVIVLTAALPAASSQPMITEQYNTNIAGASRAVFLTTLFSVVTVPLMMMFVL